jgi:hypothetical protein
MKTKTENMKSTSIIIQEETVKAISSILNKKCMGLLTAQLIQNVINNKNNSLLNTDNESNTNLLSLFNLVELESWPTISSWLALSS